MWLVFVKTIEYLLHFKYYAIVSQCFILLNPHSNPILYVTVFFQFSDKEIKAQRSSTSKVTGNKWKTKIWTRCSDSIGVFYPPFYSNFNSYSPRWLSEHRRFFHIMSRCLKLLRHTKVWYISQALPLPLSAPWIYGWFCLSNPVF